MKLKTKRVISFMCILLSAILVCSTVWAKRNFEFNDFETLFFTITNPIQGTDVGLVLRGIRNCLLLPLVVVTIFFILIIKFSNNKIIYLINKFLILITVGVLVMSSAFVYKTLDIQTYIDNQFNKTDLYDKKYVDPKTVNFTFPKEKRNLIIINLESIETTFYDKEHSGVFDEDLIPELHEIANNNTTFSGPNNQGYYDAPGATWTIASNIATTSGIPLKINTLLPGAYSLGDVLKANGYINELMKGADAEFGNTATYFSNHGDYIIKDYQYAINNSWIPVGYQDNMGFSDQMMFEFAKNELLELSKSGKPFNFTVQTIDTHIEGFICPRCEDKYELQIMNAISCSSKQVAEFIEWIQQQDFYNNTTIILIGDHTSMSKELKNVIDVNTDRRCYFTIINPAIEYKGSRNRKISSFDIYPTILASMGVKFDSDRLGLGTNLYSNTPTLLEEMGGGGQFFKEVSKSSDYYINRIIKNKK